MVVDWSGMQWRPSYSAKGSGCKNPQQQEDTFWWAGKEQEAGCEEQRQQPRAESPPLEALQLIRKKSDELFEKPEPWRMLSEDWARYLRDAVVLLAEQAVQTLCDSPADQSQFHQCSPWPRERSIDLTYM